MRPHRQQPTRFPCPWDSPGKNTGVGCHFLLQCIKVKSESEVAQSCPTLRDPMDCSPPGFSAHGIFQARVLEWGAIAFSDSNNSSVEFVKNFPSQVRNKRNYSKSVISTKAHNVPQFLARSVNIIFRREDPRLIVGNILGPALPCYLDAGIFLDKLCLAIYRPKFCPNHFIFEWQNYHEFDLKLSELVTSIKAYFLLGLKKKQ